MTRKSKWELLKEIRCWDKGSIKLHKILIYQIRNSKSHLKDRRINKVVQRLRRIWISQEDKARHSISQSKVNHIRAPMLFTKFQWPKMKTHWWKRLEMWCPHLIQRARMSTARRLHRELIQICRRSCQVSLIAQSAKWIKHILTRAFKAYRTLILTRTLVLFSGHKKKETVTWPPRINIALIRIQIAHHQHTKLKLKAIYVQLQATKMYTIRSKDQVRAQPSPTTPVGKAPFAASWLSRGWTISSNSWPKTSQRVTCPNN